MRVGGAGQKASVNPSKIVLRIIPVVGRFSSEILRAIISYYAESHLESCHDGAPP